MLYKLSQCFPKLHKRFGKNTKIELDLPNYAIKADTSNLAAKADTSTLAAKSDSAKSWLKAKKVKIDLD